MFDILGKVIDTTSDGSENLQGFRIIGKIGIANNMLTSVWVNNLNMPDEIDCFVSSTDLVELWKKAKKPVFVQENEKSLIMTDGPKSTVKFDLKDAQSFPMPDAPIGEEIEPGNLLDAFAALEAISTKTQGSNFGEMLFFVEDHIYAMTDNMVIRTQHNLDLPKPITMSRAAASLLASIKAKPISILYTDKVLSVTYENLWVKTSLISQECPINLNIFNDFKDMEFEKPDLEFLTKLTEMVNFGKKSENTVSFGPSGVKLVELGKVQIDYNHPMPIEIKLRTSVLKSILGKVTEYNFNRKLQVAARGNGLEVLVAGVF